MSVSIDITRENSSFYTELLYDSIIYNPSELERLVLLDVFEKNIQRLTLAKLFGQRYKIKLSLVEASAFEQALSQFKTQDPQVSNFMSSLLFVLSPQVENLKRQAASRFQSITQSLQFSPNEKMLEGGE